MNGICMKSIVLFSMVLFFCFSIASPFGFQTGNISEKLDFSCGDVEGNPVNLEKDNPELVVLLFFNPMNTNNKAVIYFSHVLYKKLKTKGLKIIGISSRDKTKLLDFYRVGKFSFPFIFDEDEKISSAFGIKKCCGGTVILDSNGKVRFSTSFLLDYASIRQLVEKELFEKISYDAPTPPANNFFKPGEKAPDLQLRELTSNRILSFDNFSEDYLLVTFFSTMCQTCGSGKRIRTLKALEKKLIDSQINSKMLLGFFRPFDRKDIAEWEKNIDMPFEKYISDDIVSDDAKYAAGAFLTLDPYTVVLDKKRTVILVQQPNTDEEEFASLVINAIQARSKLK